MKRFTLAITSAIALILTFAFVSPVMAQVRLTAEQTDAAAADEQYAELLEHVRKARAGRKFSEGKNQAAEASGSLVAYVAEQFGEDSELYFVELAAHAQDLTRRNQTEARLIYPQVIALAELHYGNRSRQYADASKYYADVLDRTGFGAETVDLRLRAYDIYLEEALNCDREGRSKSPPCFASDRLLHFDLSDTLNALVQNERVEEANALLKKTLTELERKWSECAGPGWSFECSRVPGRRVDYLNTAAEFQTSIGALEKALTIDNGLLNIEISEYERCRGQGDTYCSTAMLMSVFKRLSKNQQALGLNADRFQTMERVMLALSPEADRPALFVPPDLSVSLHTRIFGDLAREYFSLGQGNGEQDRVAQFFKDIDRRTDHDALESEVVLASRKLELEQQLAELSEDDPGRLPLLKQLMENAAQAHGDGSFQQRNAAIQYQSALTMQGQHDRVIELSLREIALQRATKRDPLYLRQQVLVLVSALYAEDRIEEALPILSELVEGPDAPKIEQFDDRTIFDALSHETTLSAYSDLAFVLADILKEQDGQEARALVASSLSVAIFRSLRDSFGYDPDGLVEYDYRQGNGWKEFTSVTAADRLILLADILRQNPGRDGAAIQEAYGAVQDAMSSATTHALSREMAKQFSEKQGTRDIVREWGSAMGEYYAAGRNENFSYDDWLRAKDRVDLLMLELRRASPGFFDLIRPTAISLAETRAFLGEDEAIVLIYPGPNGTHVIAVTPTAFEWHFSDWNADRVEQAVADLRYDLDPAGSGAPQPWTYAYDRQTAFDLYRQLYAPISTSLGSVDTVYVAAAGPLARLPPSVLVTSPPTGDDTNLEDLRRTDWLIDKFALVQIPSVQSLRYLRAGALASPDEPQPFIGFGDPSLEGKGAVRGGPNADALAVPENLMRGTLADVTELRKLARLPGTAPEIEAIAASLNAPDNAVFLGERATESQLKNMDLSRARILAFATHGLLAGEVDGLSEPGLVFTPPETASEIDDGVLTASEILLLQLNAEWVILSACNTATGDDAGTEGLAGLAKSFFFAGARSLLASHWPARDDLAARLSSEAVALQTAAGLSRAEAMRRSMVALRNDESDPSTAHPSSWGVFMLIGDGR